MGGYVGRSMCRGVGSLVSDFGQFKLERVGIGLIFGWIFLVVTIVEIEVELFIGLGKWFFLFRVFFGGAVFLGLELFGEIDLSDVDFGFKRAVLLLLFAG